MVIYLPLLFADGQPTSLDKITQEQLVRFIPFMVSCCSSREEGTKKPIWWPETIPYHIPLCAKGKNAEKETLKQIVCLCYEYHQCEHLLRFCARLSDLLPHSLHYKEESAGYVSILNTQGELIVKFKKKNQTYDRVISSPHKSLLPRKPQPPKPCPVIEDIYLCNYCDEEFTSVREAVAHESICNGKTEEVTSTQAIDQVSVMRYFGLCLSAEPQTSTRPLIKRGTSLRLTSKCYHAIPISSPLGAKLSLNVAQLNESEKEESWEKAEKYCKTNQSNIKNKARRPRRSYETYYSSLARRKKFIWSHTYCFNKKQREEKQLTWQTGLNKETRLLLQSLPTVSVVLEKLPLLDPLALHAAARLRYLNTVKDEQMQVTDVRQEREPMKTDSTPIIVDLCSSSEDEEEDNDIFHRTILIDNQTTPDNFLRESSDNVFYEPAPKIIKLMQKQNCDGPQYGISARSAVPTVPLLMPEESAHVPSLSSQSWLNSPASSPCTCGNGVCVCVPSQSQTMAPRRPIRI